MCHSAILFAPPKQGGILQSSGFLNLKCLMALSLTRKAHAFDELSLIQLIERELTRDHNCHTMEEAIAFCRKTYRSSLLKQWLWRDSDAAFERERAANILGPPWWTMLSEAVNYEVMFAQMLRQVPASERREVLSEEDDLGWNVLHHVAHSGKVECIRAILALYPDSSEGIQIVCMQDGIGKTILHHAAQAGKLECIKFILDLHPESERLQVVSRPDRRGSTVLHCAAGSGNIECIKTILALYPEQERVRVLNIQDQFESTALHRAAQTGNLESVKLILSHHSESDILRAVSLKGWSRMTVLHCAARSGNPELVKYILTLYPTETERVHALNTKVQRRTVLQFAAHECIGAVLTGYPEHERLQALKKKNSARSTVLHDVAESIQSGREFVKNILDLLPEQQRSEAVNVRDAVGNTVLQIMDEETRESIVEWLSESKSSGQKRSRDSALETEEVDVGQSDAKRQRSDDFVLK